jgi:hypothetical protein
LSAADVLGTTNNSKAATSRGNRSKIDAFIARNSFVGFSPDDEIGRYFERGRELMQMIRTRSHLRLK